MRSVTRVSLRVVMRMMPGCRNLIFACVVACAAPGGILAQHACTPLAATNDRFSGALATRVTVHLHDVALREALDRVSSLAKTQVAYSSDFIPLDNSVCINADNAPLGAVLGWLVSGLHVQVLEVAGKIVLSPGAAQKGELEMARSVSVLDRVVVTGNAIGTPRKPLVIGVEIIDGEQLRRQSLGSLADLLDAAVPGIWAWGQSPSSLVAQYGGIRGASSFGATYPKIYLDGIEVANPLVVTQLNPEVVDHVEVIRGPQGSALYGSDAISGVINILTRHTGGGISGNALSLRSVEGASASSFATGLVPTHEQRFTFRTGNNLRSGGIAATYGQTGALYPSADSRQLNATADTRLVGSQAVFTGTARVFDKRAGIGRNPLFETLIAQNNPPAYGQGGPAGNQSSPANAQSQSVTQYTLSTNTSLAGTGIWTHTLLAGVDGYKLEHIAEAVGPFPIALDSALRSAAGNGDRLTLRASSVAKLGTEGESEGTLTLGVEQSVLRQETSNVTRATPVGGQQYGAAVEGMAETWNHDTGLISQMSMAWHDNVFVSGGLRVERNDSFSGSDRFPLLPMIGAAVVRGYGEAELKVRAAYGKGIRPPQTPARGAANGYSGGLGTPGNGNVIPALDPEVQAGYEGGVELYVGRTLTLGLTRFDQRATGLIQYVATGVDTFSRGTTYDRRVRYQLQNVGEITNTGWEVQGNATHNGYTLASTLSSVDSRVRVLAFGYNGDLRAGDRMLAVPARTGSITLSYLNDVWFGSIGANRAWDWINYDKIALAKSFATPGMMQQTITGAGLRNYWRQYDGDTHLRVTLTRELGRGLALLLVGDNLLGGQLGEPDNATIRPGRTITGGLRASF